MYLYTLSAGYIQYTRRDVRLHKTHHLQAKIKPENDPKTQDKIPWTHFGISSLPGRWSEGGRMVVVAGVGRALCGTGPSVKGGAAAMLPVAAAAGRLFSEGAAAEAAAMAAADISCL